MMKIKFLLLGALLAGVVAIPTHAQGACQDMNFPNGGRICFEMTKRNSGTFEVRTQSSNLAHSSSLSCTLTLPNNEVVKLPRCEGTFSYGGANGKVEIEADTDQGFSMLVANYDFARGEFNNGSSSDTNNNNSQRYQNYQIELTNPGTSNPSTFDAIDAIIKVRYNGSSYYYDNFNGRVDLSVEEYRNGRWEAAYSSDFSLDRSSVYFSNSDRGELRFYRLLSFKKRGEYRLIAKINETNASAYQAFYVNTNGYDRNDSWDRERNQEYSYVQPSLRLNYSSRWDRDNYSKEIDVELRLSDYYRGRAYFELEEYRNGRWQSASSRDYDLPNQSYYFDGYKRTRNFDDFLKIYNQDNNYRLVVRLENGNYAREEIRFSTSSRNENGYTSFLNYSSSEYQKLKAVYELWPQVIRTLKADYSRLRSSSQWVRESDEFYTNMRDVVNKDRYAKFESRSKFYKAFGNWLGLTIRIRGY